MLKKSFLLLFLLIFLLSSNGLSEEQSQSVNSEKASQAGIELTVQERKWLEENPVIRARVGNNPPLHFFDGKYQGISVDYFNKISKMAGFKVEYVHDIPWPEAIKSIKTGEKFDLLLTAKNIKERHADMRFSEDYLLMPWVVFTRDQGDFISSMQDLTDKTVAVEKSFVMQRLLESQFPKVNLIERKHSFEALEAVATGAADAYIGNLATSTYLINKHNLSNLKVACPVFFGNHDQAFAVRHDWPIFVGILNKAIARIPERDMTELRNKWFNVKFEYGISKSDLFKWVTIILLFSSLILLLFLLSNQKLRREIRVRKKTEEKLNDVLLFNEKIISNAPVGISIYEGISGRCIAANDSIANLVGATKNEVLQQNYHHIESWQKSGLYKMAKEVLQQKISKRKVIQVRSSFGKSVAIDCFIAHFSCSKKDHLLLATTDVTKRLEDQKTIIRQQEKAEKYLNLAGVMFVGLDIDGNIKLLNKKACEVLEVEQQEALGQSWFEQFIPQAIREEVYTVFKQIISGEAELYENHENPIISKSGKEKIIAWHNSALRNENGKITGLLGSGEDITEKRQLRSELEQAQKMEAIGTLAGGIAHDFNNVLSSIIGFSELALAGVEKGSEVEEDIHEVLMASLRAKDLISQILMFARRSDASVEPVRIKEIAEETIKFLRSSIPSNIQIKDTLNSDSFVLGSATQIHQIFMNICTNASQAIGAAGGIIEVQLDDTSVDKHSFDLGLDSGQYVKIVISDTGPGITPENLSAVFDPYFTTKEVGEGTGMGLSVVHGIVESYGGKITVDSSPEKGTSFTIYLPQTLKTEENEIEAESTCPTGDEHILVVDDEASVVKVVSKTLESIGYKVTNRTSSIEALELFESESDSFDMVLTDMTMPDLTGKKLAEKIIAIKSDIPVILWTGYCKHLSEDLINEIGIKALIRKPIKKEELANTIRSVFEQNS